MTITEVRNAFIFEGFALMKRSKLLFQGSPGNIISTDHGESESLAADCTVDGTGCTLIPAFIDCNINAGSVDASLSKLAKYGVSTVIDLSSSAVEAQAMRRFSLTSDCMPKYLASGVTAIARNSNMSGMFPTRAVEIVRSPGEAEVFVNSRVHGPEQADYIMVDCNQPGFEEPLLAALVSAAHRHGRWAVAQASDTEAYARSSRAGFNMITHVPLDAPLAIDVAADVAAKKIICVPTLCSMKRVAERLQNEQEATMERETDLPGRTGPRLWDNALASVRTLHDAGAIICAGTGANPSSHLYVEFGASLHDEMQLLTTAGLTRLEALRAASFGAAKALGFKDYAELRTGDEASLVLVEGNPLEDINATRRIRKVWIRGIELDGES